MGIFHTFVALHMKINVWMKTRMIHYRDIVPEINNSGPMWITDLFQNKYLAYFNLKKNIFQFFLNFFTALSYVTF